MLIDDSKDLAERLEQLGADFEAAFYEDMPHGFVQMEEWFDDAAHSIAAMVAFLDARLASDRA